MASDAIRQALGRLDKAVTRAETLARKLAEERAQQIETQLAAGTDAPAGSNAVDIDPFSRDKAIAALKSLDALIGDLQKARSEA
jgi:Arc/MetJ-type ribon-helix-helix transcriptional regulator